MILTTKGRFAKRCAVCFTLIAIAGWSLAVLVESSRNAQAQSLAQEQYQSDLQYQYHQFSLGHVEDLFPRGR